MLETCPLCSFPGEGSVLAPTHCPTGEGSGWCPRGSADPSLGQGVPCPASSRWDGPGRGDHRLEGAARPHAQASAASGAQGSCTWDWEGRAPGSPMQEPAARARLVGAGASPVAGVRAGPGRPPKAFSLGSKLPAPANLHFSFHRPANTSCKFTSVSTGAQGPSWGSPSLSRRGRDVPLVCEHPPCYASLSGMGCSCVGLLPWTHLPCPLPSACSPSLIPHPFPRLLTSSSLPDPSAWASLDPGHPSPGRPPIPGHPEGWHCCRSACGVLSVQAD